MIAMETTRCPECLSDQIYAFQDSDGGVCYKCSAIVRGIVSGGMSIYEVRRLRGELLDNDRPVNEEDKAATVREKIKESVNDVRKEVQSVKDEVAALVKKKDAAPEQSVKAPGLLDRIVGAFSKKKEAEEPLPHPTPAKTETPPDPRGQRPIAARPEPVKAGSPKPVMKAADNPSHSPRVGSWWKVGPCLSCGTTATYTGKATRDRYANGKRRFVVIETTLGKQYYGCFLCGKGEVNA